MKRYRAFNSSSILTNNPMIGEKKSEIISDSRKEQPLE
jgi:hypothetical protein